VDLSRTAGDGGAAGGLRVLALVALRSGLPAEALDSAEAAIAAACAAGDDWEHGLALAVKAAILARLGDAAQAQAEYEVALDVLRENNGWGVAQTLYGMGSLARARGDCEAALRHFGHALTRYSAIDARPEIARCLAGIGWVALSQGDLALARSSLVRCLQLGLATGQRLTIARGLEAFAMLAAAQGGGRGRLAGRRGPPGAAARRRAGPAGHDRRVRPAGRGQGNERLRGGALRDQRA
jgi:tetratricopeptide (TPR) repeat protein